MEAKWVLEAKRADFYGLAKKFGIDPVTVRLMVNRGINTEEKMEKYLYAGRADEYSPYEMRGAEEAAERLLAAIRRGERILIATDFDVDGIFSGEILLTAIREAGGEAVVRAPHRTREGYGVNVAMVERACSEGISTMITCDNGIAAFDAVERAKQLGMQVIVTDHHACPYRETAEGQEVLLPQADVIVNPHQPGETYPFHGLCGAGVAYKVAEILYEKCGLSRECSDRLLEYVAVATVADVMDLTDENRIFVREGLRRLQHTENPGLRALIRACGLEGKQLTAYHIGFILGPCFNSAGRLDTAEKAFALLAAGEEEAGPLAESLREMNESRKQLTAQGVEEACAWVEERKKLEDILVIPLPDCHESIAGIVAGRVRERYHHPTIVLTRGEHGWKGSGRSIEAWDMFRGLSACRDLLTRFGGHPMAAGLSLEEENIDVLRRRVNENTGLTEKDFVPIIRIDVAMPLEYISEKLIREFNLLEPFGKGNPKPLFAESWFAIRSARILGKNRNVLKMCVENRAGTRMDAVYFGDIPSFEERVRERFGETELRKLYRGEPNAVCLSLAYYPEVDEYMGRKNLQIVVSQMR